MAGLTGGPAPRPSRVSSTWPFGSETTPKGEKDEKHISIRSKMADTIQNEFTFTLITDKGEKKEQVSYIEAREGSAQS